MPGNIAVLKLTVETKTALHIGSQAGINDVSDSLFRRNAKGELVLPGTSIAGAIRGHLTRLVPAMTQLAPSHICDALSGGQKIVDDKPAACGCMICHLMGDIRPLNEFREQNKGLSLEALETLNGRAARLIIHDAVLNTSSHIRDGVGIDRTTGASARAASAKFDFESIPAGFPFTIWLELEDANDLDWYLLKVIFYEWQQGRLRFGGNKSRGTGVLLLTDVQVEAYDLAKTGHLMNFLRRESTQPSLQPYPIIVPNRNASHGTYQAVAGSVQSWLTIDFELQATGFFLTNDTTQATARGYDHRSLEWLPGASLRGAIRSQAERIARTLVNLRVDVNNEDDFLRYCPAPNPFVTQGDKQNGIESSPARIRRKQAALQENQQKSLREDANAYDLAEQLFGSVDWGSRLAVEDAPMMHQPIWKKLDFVAIDRFTGGAADGAKFDAVALWQPRFSCRLHLEAPQDWEIGWLLYVLKALIDGRVPVGFGAAKGFGDVKLENLRLTLGYAYLEAAPLNDLPTEGNNFFYEVTATEWDQIAQSSWLEAWDEQLNNFTVKVEHGKSDNQTYRDPYWRDHNIKDEENFLPLHILYNRKVRIDDYLKPE